MARPRGDIRTRVLHAGRKRFLLEGVDGASLRHIARDAKTSIGMVYYYFPTKDDLFLGVVEEVYSVVLADLLQALEPALPVEERILRLYSRVSAVKDDELMVIRLVLREALVSSKRLDSIIARFERGHLPLMIQLVMDGLQAGTFDRTLHPFVIILAMMGIGGPGQLLARAANLKRPELGLPTGADLSAQMLQVLLKGAGAKPGQ
jgi:AcrR family transcriptional regulator